MVEVDEEVWAMWRKPEAVRAEDAEARALRAGLILARMRTASATYEQQEEYARRMRCFSDHSCSAKQWCWESLPRGAAVLDPLTKTSHKATGRVFVCKVSGRTHVCDGTDCYAYSRLESNGTVVCWVSGIDLGPSTAMASPTASRKRIREANIATAVPTALAISRRGVRCEGVGAKSVSVPPPKRGASSHGKRFAQGSVAEEMQRARPDEHIRYGRELIAFARALVSQDSQRAALDWCHFLTHTAPRTTWRAELAAAYAKADAMAQRYTNLAVSGNRRIDPIGFRCAIFTLFDTYFSDQVQHAEWLAFCSYANRAAEAYFSEAMVVLWKITECTPSCCEHHAVLGGPTRKKQRTRAHLRNVACALIYLLAEGYKEKVRYDRVTRLVLSDADVERSVADRVCEEHVVFIPRNNYLLRCLPSPQHLNTSSLSFDSVICGSSSVRSTTGASERQAAADFSPDLMANMAWIRESLRSLKNVRPAMTIDALREYRLCNYIKLHDTCPITGKFVPIES